MTQSSDLSEIKQLFEQKDLIKFSNKFGEKLFNNVDIITITTPEKILLVKFVDQNNINLTAQIKNEKLEENMNIFLYSIQKNESFTDKQKINITYDYEKIKTELGNNFINFESSNRVVPTGAPTGASSVVPPVAPHVAAAAAAAAAGSSPGSSPRAPGSQKKTSLGLLLTDKSLSDAIKNLRKPKTPPLMPPR
jgi:hypothetical protein